MTPGMIGGIFLVLGAIALSKGKADLSLILYFVADIMWLLLAINQGDKFGAASIIIGVTFSTYTFLKMRSGEFHNDLRKNKNTTQTN